jgi:hypothetical protein
MASLSLREAARRAGISRSTLHRAVQAGTISVTRTESKAILVDPSELARAFPPKPSPEPAQGQTTSHPKGHEGMALDHRDVALARAEARLEALTQVVEDLKVDRDAWRSQAERLALPKPEPARTWWWPWSRPL